jgi:two-component system, NarL family, nitrate/nitrite response regulator NarL
MSASVLIVEDHELLAQSLVLALRAEGFDVRESHARSPEPILAEAQDARPDIVLLDLDIGGELGTTVSLIEPLREQGATVLMLTGVDNRVRLAECIEAGALGIVGKSQPFDELVAAIRDAVEGKPPMSDAERQDLLAELRRHRDAERQRTELFDRLTPREQDVLAGLMDGKTAEEIARQSYVSLATVRSQIRAILMKLGVRSQLAAVAAARRAGWSADRG